MNNEQYKEYVRSCWIWARETAISLPEIEDYDQEIVLAFFDKLCQPYHYWKKERSK